MMDLASYSDRGGRAENEDSVRELRQDPDRLCLVVADGLGGHGGGSLASSTAVEVICGAWPGTADVEDLTDMVLRANRAVLSKQLPDCCMKTTVALLALEGAKAAWAHVGDTRLYHFYQGRLDFQTKDHSASQVAVLLGEITPDQIRFHVDRSRILRALGQKDDMRVETKDLALSPGRHAFLLCTDGFWEYVLEAEMVQDLAKAGSAAAWLDLMRARLAQRAPEDNDNNTAAAVLLDI